MPVSEIPSQSNSTDVGVVFLGIVSFLFGSSENLDFSWTRYITQPEEHLGNMETA